MDSGKSNNTLEDIIRNSTKAAEIFVNYYYKSLDNKKIKERIDLVTSLYSINSRITWNGNPIPFNDLHTFLERLPITSHEIQAFDCHPISGSSTGPPPSLVVSVTGQVTSGPSAPSPSASGNIQARDFDFLPRVFNQSFILTHKLQQSNLNQSGGVAAGGGEGGDYVISADVFRFC